MKHFQISNGFVLMDDEDFDRVSKYIWHIDKQGYARRVDRSSGKKVTVLMHRFVLGLGKSSVHVDHINLQKNDNRKSNLRLADRAQNSQNRPVLRNNLLGIKGVKLFKQTGKYCARIRVKKKLIHLGYFQTPQEASDAYWEAAKKNFGEFARR